MAKNRNTLNSLVVEAHDHDLLIETREIFLYKHKDDEDCVDIFSINKLIKNLRILESQSNKTIYIHQFSYGGDVNAGLAGYDAIKSCISNVVIYLWGAAVSCGSLIPQAADYRIIAPNTSLLVHEGSDYIHGTHKQSKSLMERSEKQTKLIYDIYADRCVNGKFFKDKGSDHEEVKKFIKRKLDSKEDWVISANEAVNLGFADCVLGSEGHENLSVIRKKYDI